MGDELRTGDVRVAVVHPLVESIRGGEKVFFELARLLPDAELFTLHHQPGLIPPDLAPRLQTSFLQRRAIRRLPFRAFLPLLPAAVRSLATRTFDLIVSSSSGWSHGVAKRDGAYQLCYMHTPPRYLWHERPPVPFGRALNPLISAEIRHLRRWDVDASSRVNRFLVNSETSRRRVAAYYGREAEVVHPPVDIDRWFAAVQPARDHVVATGELVPYKRFDLAIQACRLAAVPLVIIGDGPQRRSLQRLAGNADIRFVGRVDEATYTDIVASARIFLHPGVEDFGIATVEALAAGVPVVGSSAGGTGEIVTPGTGVLVPEPDPEAFAAAIHAALNSQFDRSVLQARARYYAPQRFRTAILAAVREALS